MTSNLLYELKFMYFGNLLKSLLTLSLISSRKTEITWADNPFDL